MIYQWGARFLAAFK